MSSRARVYGVVAAAALAAAALAVSVAWVGRGETDAASGTTATGARAGLPPLALDVLVADPEEATALAAIVKLYQDGEPAAAAAAFEDILTASPGSVPAAVGAAFARWPDGTMDRLRELEQENPSSGLVELHVGIALYWQGQTGPAQAAWRKALAVDPDSPAALRAESLLHPDMPPGRPFFVSSATPPAGIADLAALEQLSALERQANETNDAASWLLYGAGLQRAGRPLSAQTAFDRAVALEPDDPEALTAAAVGRFTKDDPSQAFARLGPLGSRYPDAAVVRFHLGLCLLWLSDVEKARSELEAAKADGPGTVWAQQATLLLDKLAGAS